MKMKLSLLALITSGLLSGCLSSMSADQALGLGAKGFQALSLTDAQVQSLSDSSCANFDSRNTIAASGSQYGKRLNNIAAGLPKNINGKTASYKVYMTKEVNAWAMANGCIRVYSGLMDMMNDDEVRGVLAHEVGHVDLGHSKSAMRLAMMSSFGRDVLANSSNSAIANLSSSEIGDFGEKFINAQFSQSQETAADDYAYKMLVANKKDVNALASSFDKMSTLGSSSSILSSHPDAKARAKRVRAQIAKDAK